MRRLTIEPLTQAAFAPFGEVIETEGRDWFPINNGSTHRYHHLATVQTARPEDRAIISLVVAARPLPMPLTIRMLERHPLGSQAFVPLLGRPFLIVVAAAGEAPRAEDVRAFRSDGRQGVNYHCGVWHHPLLALEQDDRLLVIDRSGAGDNCDEHHFEVHEQLLLDPAPAFT